MKRAAIFLLFCSACGGENEQAPVTPKGKAEAPRARAPAAPAPSPAETAPAGGEEASGAVEAVRHYFALIAERRFDEAWRMRHGRSGERAPEAFAAQTRQQVTIGEPSLPVEAGGALFVEIPVHIYGRSRDGRPIASAGTVTLVKPAGERRWRIAG